MNVLNVKNKHILLSIIIVALYFFGGQKVFASATDGTIPADSYAWGENLSWINFGTSTGNIHVTDSAVTGYAWTQNFGWINFNATNGGVTNNTSGTLGGYAWSSGKGGWIPFAGVTINSSGKFTGIAGISGTDAGRINFDCTHCNVTTDWRPSSGGGTGGGASTTTTTTSAGGGGAPVPTTVPVLSPGPATTFVSSTTTQSQTTVPAQLFDVLAQPVLQKTPITKSIQAGFILLILFLILLYIIYRVNREIKRRQIEKIKKIKRIKNEF